MERIKHTFKKLTIRKSFALLILLFLLLDIFLCLTTAGLLQLLPGKYYALSSPLIVCLYSALCLAAAAYLFYKCKLEEPVRLIKEAAARIGRQDLDFRLSYDSNDEMGELCRSVESMRLALEDNYHLLWNQAEEKKRINAAFAHDMRTPLTIIKGYLEFQELSAGSMSPKDLQKQAAIMKKHLARMENYIAAMNSLATPDSIRALPSLISPRKLEEDLFRTAAMLCGRLHKSFVPESLLPGSPLSADPEIISRVLDNILSNAAAHASRTVTLRLSLKQGALLAEVSDDGPGFTAAALEKGCDPFFTEARDNGHQGLGLYTSRLLCLAHHGSLTLANAPEGGARVTAAFLLFQE
ncbi:HAMP domain-containing sensor histidine kinase [Eisenbergiella sp.]